MTIATFVEASKMMGYKSPSTLYKLRKEGQLDDYLVDIQGRWHLVMKPAGKPKLKDYLASIVQWRIGNLITKIQEKG